MMIALLERERLAFVAATSEADYDWAHRTAVVARQAARVFRAWPTGVSTGEIPPAAWQAAGARDAAMADNVRWVLDQEGSRGRVLVFAHNAHVKNAATEWNLECFRATSERDGAASPLVARQGFGHHRDELRPKRGWVADGAPGLEEHRRSARVRRSATVSPRSPRVSFGHHRECLAYRATCPARELHDTPYAVAEDCL